MINNFKKYDNFIANHKYDMIHFIIYYNLRCGIDYLDVKNEDITNEQIEKIVYFIYNAYMKDENHIDLGFMCDKALEHFDDIIQERNFTKWDLLRVCYE